MLTVAEWLSCSTEERCLFIAFVHASNHLRELPLRDHAYSDRGPGSATAFARPFPVSFPDPTHPLDWEGGGNEIETVRLLRHELTEHVYACRGGCRAMTTFYQSRISIMRIWHDHRHLHRYRYCYSNKSI